MLLCAYVIYFITNIICGHMCEKNQYEVTNIPKPLTNWSLIKKKTMKIQLYRNASWKIVLNM